MRSLTDLRVLVLDAASTDQQGPSDLALLGRRSTMHRLPLAQARTPVTLLRVLKRLVMHQDDLMVLYEVPPLVGLVSALSSRLWRRPVLAIPALSTGRFAALATRAATLALLPAPSKPEPRRPRAFDRRAGAAETAGGRDELLLRAVARLARRPGAAATRTPLRLDIGCGSQVRPGFVGIDARRTVATAVVADARAIPVGSHLADEVYASCLLEHFDDPHEVLRQIHRILRPEGQAVLRLPNLGTYSSHLDTTHRFLADLALWRRILTGYFGEIQVVPVGTKYRDNPWLVRVNWLLVNGLQWYELAQGWDFICRKPKALPSIEYTAWWEE